MTPRARSIAELEALLDPQQLHTLEESGEIVRRALRELRRIDEYFAGESDSPHGALQMAMTAEDGKVVVGFAEKVGWLAFAWNQAERLAAAFATHAQTAKEQRRLMDVEAQRTPGGMGDRAQADGEGEAPARAQGDGAHEAYAHDEDSKR